MNIAVDILCIPHTWHILGYRWSMMSLTESHINDKIIRKVLQKVTWSIEVNRKLIVRGNFTMQYHLVCFKICWYKTQFELLTEHSAKRNLFRLLFDLPVNCWISKFAKKNMFTHLTYCKNCIGPVTMSNWTYKQKELLSLSKFRLEQGFNTSFRLLQTTYSHDKVTSCYDFKDRGNDHLRVIDYV